MILRAVSSSTVLTEIGSPRASGLAPFRVDRSLPGRPEIERHADDAQNLRVDEQG